MFPVNLWMRIQNKRSESWPCLSMNLWRKILPFQCYPLVQLSEMQFCAMGTIALIHATCWLPLLSLKIQTPCASGQLRVLGMLLPPLFVKLAPFHSSHHSLQVTYCSYSKPCYSLAYYPLLFPSEHLSQSVIILCIYLFTCLLCFLN